MAIVVSLIGRVLPAFLEAGRGRPRSHIAAGILSAFTLPETTVK